MADAVPIITIDGPSGSGKGTVTQAVAARLGWRVLDSGALYRLLGLAVRRAGLEFDNALLISQLARKIKVEFEKNTVRLDGDDVSAVIRTEGAGGDASRVAAMPVVRAALLQWQRDFAQPPGLVADGRDMGTTVFPQALLKIFLVASPEARALRRYKQLKEKGLPANLATLKLEIEARDARDRERAASPLLPAPDAVEIDSTDRGVDEVVDMIWQMARKVYV